MAVTYLNPRSVGQPIGLYSHVATTGNLHFLAGQLGLTASGELAGESMAEQVPQVFKNIQAILADLGLGPKNIIKFTTYVVGQAGIEEFYEARVGILETMYPDGAFPPHTLLSVSRLANEMYRVEIEAVAAE